MISYLRAQFQQFSTDDFSPRSGILGAIGSFVAWSFPAFLAVMFTRWLGRCRSVQYFDAAIAEGIGPHLWNVIGTIGIFLFGLFLLLPQERWLARASNSVLINTYSIGSLTFGLIFGQWFYEFQMVTLEAWHAWANALGFGFLFFVIFMLNLFIWYLGFLSDPSRLNIGFASTLPRLDFRIRGVISLVLCLLDVVLLMRMK